MAGGKKGVVNIWGVTRRLINNEKTIEGQLIFWGLCRAPHQSQVLKASGKAQPSASAALSSLYYYNKLL